MSLALAAWTPCEPDETATGRVRRGQKGEAPTASSPPGHGSHLKLGRFRLETEYKIGFRSSKLPPHGPFYSNTRYICIRSPIDCPSIIRVLYNYPINFPRRHTVSNSLFTRIERQASTRPAHRPTHGPRSLQISDQDRAAKQTRNQFRLQ